MIAAPADLRQPYTLFGPVVSFKVFGDPIGQGNIRHLGKGRPAIHQNQDLLLPWRDLITVTAHNAKLAAGTSDLFPLIGPVGLAVHFTMAKPKAAPKRRRTFPITRPDGSHLLRAAEDAITASGIWKDDSQIVDTRLTKHYPGEHVQALDVPGVLIRVYQIDDGS